MNMSFSFTFRAFLRMVAGYLPLHSRKRRALCVLLIVNAGLLALASRFVGLNTSTSAMPEGFYWRMAAHPARGQAVEVCLPHAWAKFAIERRYIGHSWRCPDGSEAVGKMIMGMPGDTVTVDPATVLKVDTLGRPMPHVFGPQHLGIGQIWLYGSARNSFDSRYYGAVPAANVIANLAPLWTWGGK
jgi:conjugative transfer signal peptidase TraF